MNQKMIAALLAAAGCAAMMTGCWGRSKNEAESSSQADRPESSVSESETSGGVLNDAEDLVSDVVDEGKDMVSDIADGAEDVTSDTSESVSDSSTTESETRRSNGEDSRMDRESRR